MSRSSADVLDENGHRPGVRNGYHQQRDVATGAGAVTVTAPRVNDKRVDDETGDRQPDAVPPGHPALTARDEAVGRRAYTGTDAYCDDANSSASVA